MIIAIDGPSASGKGTLARMLAKHFGLPHLDTGTLYRAVALKLLQEGFDESNLGAAVHEARHVARHLDHIPMKDPKLRSERVAGVASLISTIPELRAHLLELQRYFAHQPEGAVLDGRDIGTVIVPEAEVKIYVVASPEKRAERRMKELQNNGQTVTYEAVLKDLRARDARDASRDVAPAKQAADAVLLDTSDLTVEQAFLTALAIVKEKTGRT